MANTNPPNNLPWHAAGVDETIARLSTSIDQGLSSSIAEQRQAQFGPNQLEKEEKEPFWKNFLEELREPMVLLLLFTGVLYAVWGEWTDALVIFLVILALNTVEVLNERRAKNAINGLRKLAEPTAPVWRDGRRIEIAAEALVPGDVIALETGRRVAADARLVEAYGLAVDESALTGESLPVEKMTLPAASGLPVATPLADRHNMVYSGTLVTRGRGLAVVTATGMDSEIGHTLGLVRGVKEPRTPLQRSMSELSKSLVWLALGFSVLIPVLGVFVAHQPLQPMLLTGLSLAFATIPEEMPIIITLVLALGAYRLSKNHAIVKRLKAVETLGSMTVIATDKTGTLTENQLEVVRLEGDQRRLLEIGALASSAELHSGPDGQTFTGDPLETALLRAARQSGLDVAGLRQESPRLEEFSFDNERKRMSTVWARKDGPWAAVKGAPETVMNRSLLVQVGDQVELLPGKRMQAWREKAAAMAQDGLRVIGMAERDLPKPGLGQDEVENGLKFIGLVGLADPPRAGVREAIAACYQAGIRVLMITGDHPITARAVAQAVGLEGAEVLSGAEVDRLTDEDLRQAVQRVSIYARVTPAHKLRIVQALEANGARVAVTGDGINDAPALAAADIGVAMGERGTDVAREAADMVLADDNFATIVSAVKEGRLLYENLKKGVRYYLACKVALVLTSLLPVLLLAPVPFAPVQIILMELFMDLAAAATFAAEPPEADLLNRKPRSPQERFMDWRMLSSIFSAALGLFAAVSTAYLLTWFSSHDPVRAQTVAFFAWMIGHVVLAVNMRSVRQPVTQLGLLSSRLMLMWAAAVAIFLALLSLITPLQPLFRVTTLPAADWGLIVAAVIIGTFWMELWKRITYRPEK